ncbi:MAG TPA: phosphoenolpyruvate--protein phosphotransferase [Pseudogracilibacillus sp.]|nr:phosphoenolpyruvate--protein phosphotransferase [Pseudogracilibacillus sp.]
MYSIKGITAARGIAFGTAYKLATPNLTFETRTIKSVQAEMERLQDAISKSREEIKQIRKQVKENQGEDNAMIFDSHLLMLDDPYYMETIEQIVTEEKINVESAVVRVTDLLLSTFKQLNNLYIRERITDIQDVVDRVLANLLGKSLPNISLIQDEASIIVAPELKPSETVQIDCRYVQGFVTDFGGKTSHAAIIARSLELSAIVGAKKAMTTIEHGDELIVDGINGLVHINPTAELTEQYREKQRRLNAKRFRLTTFKRRRTVTRDNQRIEIHANINSEGDIERAVRNGIDGIGLFRSEFIFMNEVNFPSEETQYTMYKRALLKMNGRPVVVRTLDIGGDKQLPYYTMPEETNPFLGLRSIRFTLEEKELFKTQLRALLRASVHGNLKIMFPMITTFQELQAAKSLLEEVKQSLKEEQIPFNDEIEIGMMIETPATALLADLFIKEVDFFSIGTNDLIQYTFATDRMNERVAHLYEPLHPAILRITKQVIDVAKAHGKWVKICGEMASDERALPLLIGFGLTSLSMDPGNILNARKQINYLTYKQLKSIAEKAIQVKDAKEVEKLLVTHRIIKH